MKINEVIFVVLFLLQSAMTCATTTQTVHMLLTTSCYTQYRCRTFPGHFSSHFVARTVLPPVPATAGILQHGNTWLETTRFTKRVPGMSELTYYARLKTLSLRSLELRRVRADLILLYKIVLGLLSDE